MLGNGEMKRKMVMVDEADRQGERGFQCAFRGMDTLSLSEFSC